MVGDREERRGPARAPPRRRPPASAARPSSRCARAAGRGTPAAPGPSGKRSPANARRSAGAGRMGTGPLCVRTSDGVGEAAPGRYVPEVVSAAPRPSVTVSSSRPGTDATDAPSPQPRARERQVGERHLPPRTQRPPQPEHHLVARRGAARAVEVAPLREAQPDERRAGVVVRARRRGRSRPEARGHEQAATEVRRSHRADPTAACTRARRLARRPSRFWCRGKPFFVSSHDARMSYRVRTARAAVP